MALDDPLTLAIIVSTIVAAIVSCGVVIFLMRRRYNPPQTVPKRAADVNVGFVPSPYKVTKSVQSTDASRARDELRILELEREILGDAIRHLYEAHAEGKITEAEREKLASSYKQRMMSVKESIARDETIVALHELESMQEDLMKMFSERFGELSGKVEELRGRIELKPVKEVKIQIPKPQAPLVPDQMEKEEEEEEESEAEGAEGEEKPKKKRKQTTERPTQKTEAEMRIDAIRSEIDKVMDRLGQMEIES